MLFIIKDTTNEGYFISNYPLINSHYDNNTMEYLYNLLKKLFQVHVFLTETTEMLFNTK